MVCSLNDFLFLFIYFLLNSVSKRDSFLLFSSFVFFFFCSYKALEPLIATGLVLKYWLWWLGSWGTWQPVLEMTVDPAGRHIILDLA